MGEGSNTVPVILDFSGDAVEAFDKLEGILCTSGWKHLIIGKNSPDETKLLFSLIRERAIVVGEVSYTPVYDFSEEFRQRALEYFHRLRKRDMDIFYLNAVNYFSRYEPDIDHTNNGSLFYPAMQAYVRCGDLLPDRFFELLQKDGCERVIVFGSGFRYDRENPEEVFHSFEMSAPKEYIIKRLQTMQDERMVHIYEIINKADHP